MLRLRTTLAVAAALVVALGGCGKAGSSGTKAPDAQATGAGCAGVKGDQLVVLADDKKLQLADNVVPAVNAKFAGADAATTALDKVSAGLDQAKLIGLNKAVNGGKSPEAAAKEFAQANNLTSGLSGGSGKVVVGAADFPESETLARLYAAVLTAAGFQATVQPSGTRESYEPDLEAGKIQVMPEYLATLTEFLNRKKNGKDAKTVATSDPAATATALKGLGKDAGLVFGKYAEATDTNAFAVTKAFADKYAVKTLSDLATKCSGKDTVLGAGPECPERPFCQKGLESTYGIKFGGFKALDVGGPLTKTGLRTGTISVGLSFSSDADLAT